MTRPTDDNTPPDAPHAPGTHTDWTGELVPPEGGCAVTMRLRPVVAAVIYSLPFWWGAYVMWRYK